MSYHVSIEDAIRQLKNEQLQPFTLLMKHGTMSLEYYAPKHSDLQTPHKQNEIYVIASGQATFFRHNETLNCKAGDVLFVPAHMEHRFENFSDDFATWVIFYGADGGEHK